MDVKYIGGDVPWTLPFGDHFYPSVNETKTNNLTSTSDLDLIARRHGFEPLYATNETESQSNMQWMNSGVLFTDKKIRSEMNESSTIDFLDNHGHTFCYLCSINAHEHERSKPRDPSQRRKLIPYNNPKALKARSASLERPSSSSSLNSVPYRFIVRTGTLKNSGTRAQVFLYMYGTEKNWTSINMQTRSNNDGFPSGSIRTICLKGPDIGQLHHLNVNIIGARSDKEWFLKEIEITNLNTSITWLCEFNCWLPKKDEHQHEIKPTESRHKEISFDNLTVYVLQVRTGGKAFAGTDSNIQVVIRGSTSQTRRLALTSDRANLFEQNQLDTFAVVGWDIGDLVELTIESDRTQMAADWDLKEIIMWKIVPQEKNKRTQAYFVFNTWLGKEKSTLKTKKDTYSPTEFNPRGPTCYRLEIKTGNKSNAGTDANVFVIIYGKNGRTSTHHLDNPKKNDFEKGSTSQFTIMDFDVGEIEQIKIWHDNSGIGAAWYLESVVVRKIHSTCRTVTNIYTQRLEQISQVLYKQAREQIKKISNSKDSDDLSSNRSILRSLMLSDKMNSQKKVTWDEQSIGSQDEPIRINTKQMRDKQTKLLEKSSQIDSGHFNHHAYWISSHNYLNNKWQIQSIEERNRFNLDESIRSTLLSDRLASSDKIKTISNERDDEVYEFEANRWLEKDKLEVYLTPKNKRLSSKTVEPSISSPKSNRSTERLIDSHRPSSRTSNDLNSKLADERELLKRISKEPPYHSRSTASSLIDTRGRSPRLGDELIRTATATKKTEPSFRPKSAVRSTPELSRRDQVYSSAYGTIDDF